MKKMKRVMVGDGMAVVTAAGIRANTDLAVKIALHCGPNNRGGIVVSDAMQTTIDPGI